MKCDLLLVCVISGLLLQDGCSSTEPHFVEIPIASRNTKDGYTESLVFYVKRADLSETGVSASELKETILAMFDAIDDALVESIRDMLPSASESEPQQKDAKTETPGKKRRSLENERMAALFDRGVFMEVRESRDKEVKIMLRGVIRFPKKREGKADITEEGKWHITDIGGFAPD